MDTLPAGDIAQEEAGSDESWAPLVARLCFAAAEEFQKADKGYVLSHRASDICLPLSPGFSLTQSQHLEREGVSSPWEVATQVSGGWSALAAAQQTAWSNETPAPPPVEAWLRPVPCAGHGLG